MGLGLHFTENEGPQFERPIRSLQDIKALRIPDMETDLGYVTSAIRLVHLELAGKVPLIGFSGSPWTLATYMIEGASSKTFSIIKKLLLDDPLILHQLLELLTTTVADYLHAQIVAGADVVMIFDTWGGVLTPKHYQDFSLHYMTKIIQTLKQDYHHANIPIILFTKNGGQSLEIIADSGCNAIGIDWTTEIGQARSRVGHRVALQGNMDPAVLHAKPEHIRQEVAAILDNYGAGSGHVFNLGHGIHKNVPVENVAIFVEAVHELSKNYHKK